MDELAINELFEVDLVVVQNTNSSEVELFLFSNVVFNNIFKCHKFVGCFHGK